MSVKNKMKKIINFYEHSDCIKSIYFIDKFGKEQGTVTNYRIDGTVSSEGNFVDGKLDGVYKTYEIEDGENRLRRYIEYRNDEFNGKNIWYRNGKIQCYSEYMNGNLHGNCKIYNNEFLIEDSNYVNGNKHGKTEVFINNKWHVLFYNMGENVTDEVLNQIDNINVMSIEEKTTLTLKYGFTW